MKSRTLIPSLAFTYLAAAISFGVQFWLAKTLGAATFGTFTFGILIANVLEVLILFGSDRTLIRDLVQSDKPLEVFWLANKLKAIVASFAIPLAALYLLTNSEGWDTTLLLTCMLGLTGCVKAFTPSSWFDFRGKLANQVGIVLIEKILFAGLVFASVFFLESTPTMTTVTSAFCISVIVGISLEWIRRPHGPESISATKFKTLTMQGMAIGNLPIALAALGNLGMTHINQLTLKSSLGPVALANFAIAFQVARISNLFFSQFGRFFGPKIARVATVFESRPRFVMQSLFKIAAIAFACSLSLSVTLYFGGWFLISNFLPPSYEPAVTILIFLCAWCAFFGPATVVNRFIVSLHMKQIYFTCATVFGAISVALGYVLIPRFGGSGAAIALLAGHMGSTLTQLVLVGRNASKFGGVQIKS